MLAKYRKILNKGQELYLRIKVHPGADKNYIKEIMEDETVKIDVAAPPVRGKANLELIKFLARKFEVKKENVKIISGAKERIKLIKVIK